MAPEHPPRRFAPTPVETSTKSSKAGGQPDKDATPKAPRRFNVEPVESSSKSSKTKESDTPQKAARKFAVQPVETSAKSSKKSDEATEKPKSRFAPQPLEMSTKSSRRKASPPSDDDDPPSPKSIKPPLLDQEPEKPKRRFAPQLIDTAKRTRKASDPLAPLPIHHKTDVIPSHVDAHSKKPGPQAPTAPVRHIPLPHERRRDRSLSHSSLRSHSFRCPDLETIESSESEPSVASDLSSSASSSADSPLTSSDIPVNEMYKHATRIRESVDESFSRYMLELEARRAELKMQEQALAAFPNSDYHEPVEHYVDEDQQSDDVEIDDRPATWDGHDDEEDGLPKAIRRDTTKMNWELQEMQRHHEELEQDRNAASTTAKRTDTNPSPWWKPAATDNAKQKDTEFIQMRESARPPMLGDDIEFPRSSSPEPARFDVTQSSQTLKNQMCYLSEIAAASSTNPDSPDGLWLKSKSTDRSMNSTQSQGLWGGFCLDNGESKTIGLAPPSGPTGLLTPAIEQGNPFEQQSLFKVALGVQKPPPTPPIGQAAGTDSGMSRIDSILQADKELDELMEREYPDTFITQVYNYLSLGYPSLARPFDEELSKISHVPMVELRQDDEVAKSMPKGYIRLGEDFEGRGDGSSQELLEDGCARWRALKKYVREWARQEKGMVPAEPLGGNWGTGARRGSWAW